MSFADLVFPKVKNGAEAALLVWIIEIAALFPDSITFAAQGGIVSAAKPKQRVI